MRPRAWPPLLLAMLALGAGCDVCGLIRQEVIVSTSDPDLASLIEDCRAGAPSSDGGAECTPTVNGDDPAFQCGCLPLCLRLQQIVVPEPARTPLEACSATFAADEVHVTLEYRSRCR